MSTLNHWQRFIVLFALASLLLSGCSFGAAQEQRLAEVEEVSQTEAEPAVLAPQSLAPDLDSPAEVAEAAKEVPVDRADAPGEAASDYAGAGGSLEAAPMATALPITEAAEPLAVEVETAQTQALRAGEVDDNQAWDDYLLYRRNYQGPGVHDRDISERYVVQVTDGQGYPVLGATVRFFLPGQSRQELFSATTYANGQVLFHPLALANVPLEQVDRFVVDVQKDDLLQQFSLTRAGAQASTNFTDRWQVTLDTRAQSDSLNLDVLFLVDATGSMADEIAKIQSTIFDVAAQIDALPAAPSVRYGLVTYRDHGDSYVTRTYEFNPNVRDFAQDLNTVFADGGGDYPEALNEGLHEALHGVEWRGGQAVQLIFLIADAPPHLDYANGFDYAEEMEIAAQRGIKIFPIASSGLDDQGEYIFRQLAQYTQGRFIFLTYAGPTNGGAPGDVTTHHVDDYSVENLDQLLVRLVEDELAHQTPRLAQAQQ